MHNIKIWPAANTDATDKYTCMHPALIYKQQKSRVVHACCLPIAIRTELSLLPLATKMGVTR